MKPIDISDLPELRKLAEEVQRSQEPRLLRCDDEDLAMIVPLGSKKGRPGSAKTEADYEAFRPAAGSWKDLVDTDKLIEDIFESRKISSRPSVEL